MKILSYTRGACLALCLLVTSVHAMNTTAVNEVLKLKNAGLGDDGIVAFIKNRNVNYDLSADDVLSLKNQGVNSAVLAAMLSSGIGQSSPTAVPAPANPPPSIVPATPTVPLAPTVAPPPPLVRPGLSPDAAYFYQQLTPYGQWIVAEDNQWYWQPTLVRTSPTWRPYWDLGHWIYTDSGWYWASDYPWGWAAFHYGRWRLHPLHGWMWLPDRVWAPAWVTWRTGGDSCGWAPLPPGADFDVAGGLVFNGRHVAVDFDFGLDWHHFNFCLLRDMGDAHLSSFRRPDERRALFYRTTMSNHYTVSRTVVAGRTEMKVFNHGVEPMRVATAKGHNIETVRIQDLHTPAPNKPHERYDKDHKTIEVYRPHWGEGH